MFWRMCDLSLGPSFFEDGGIGDARGERGHIGFLRVVGYSCGLRCLEG
jgi:hypothetical protein